MAGSADFERDIRELVKSGLSTFNSGHANASFLL